MRWMPPNTSSAGIGRSCCRRPVFPSGIVSRACSTSTSAHRIASTSPMRSPVTAANRIAATDAGSVRGVDDAVGQGERIALRDRPGLAVGIEPVDGGRAGRSEPLRGDGDARIGDVDGPVGRRRRRRCPPRRSGLRRRRCPWGRAASHPDRRRPSTSGRGPGGVSAKWLYIAARDRQDRETGGSRVPIEGRRVGPTEAEP